ncbi:MAG: response regulator, partial [Gammaproteobacteria bacterium]|nr:response regulator [Gammaproteobacteria bacterium]
RTYLEAFRLLGGITLLTLLLGPVASHLLVRPLRRLSEVSRDVPAKLMHATPIDWPVSGVSEFARLTENIRLMATSLGRTFAELRTARDELERRVEERTASLKESAARTQAIVDNAVEGIITIDEEGLVESFNPAAERIFGYSAGEVLGRSVSMLMPEPYHTGHAGYIRRYLETGERRVMGVGREAEGRRKDGTVFPLEIAVSEVPFPDRHLFTGIVRDISERKKMDRMKSEFISTVSHELRTPLTSIRGSLGLVIGGVSGDLPEQARGLIEIANKNSERLSRLINDILDAEKIESGRMAFDIRPVALLPIIEQVIEANQAYATQYGVHIVLESAEEGLSVLADPDRLSQVFTNLLSNAAKFSPQGGAVNVAVAENAGEVRIAITDAGAGIPEEFRPHVFEKFSQADASDTRRSGGTGLGLSIAKAIVERLGGRIDFESVPGAGTTFTVDLPLWSGPGTQIFTRRRSGGERGVSRVLVCEDDPDVGTLLRLMLEQEGYRADIATSLGQARTLLAKERYAAMTLDIMLPDGNGLELLHELRRDERTAGLPVIIVSAVADVHRQEVDGEALAVVDWLRKPIDQEQLIQAVQRAASGPRPRILHVEDDPDVQRVVGDILRDFARVEVASNRADAESALEQGGYSLVILDLELPDGSGLSLLPLVGRFQPPVPVVIFSAHEQDHVLADEVAAALVKSRTTNHELVATIRGILGEHGELPASPDGHPGMS